MATVLEREDLGTALAIDLAGALGRLAGVEVREYGGLSGLATVSVRGVSASQTLVVVDGIPMSDVQTGGTNLRSIPLDEVERVEVIRGPAAALYGADAVGGVIAIATRRAQESGVEIRSERGLYGLERYGVEGHWVGRGLAVTGLFGRHGGDGDYPYTGKDGSQRIRRNAGFDASHGLVRLRAGRSGRTTLDLLWERTRDFREDPPVLGGEPPGSDPWRDLEAWVRDRRGRAYLALTQPLAPGIALEARAARHALTQRHMETAYGPRARVDTVATDWRRATTRMVSFEAQAALGTEESTRASARLGWEGRWDAVRSTSLGGSRRRHVRRAGCPFASALVSSPPLARQLGALSAKLLLSGRYDRYSDFGGLRSAKVGATVAYGDSAGPRVSLRGGWGTAYRAPTMNEQFWSGFGASGNPNIRPERAAGYEAGADFNARRLSASVTAFRTTIEDFILWFRSFAAYWTAQNLDRVRTQGAEVEGAWSAWPGRLDINWAYTFLDARDALGERNPLYDGKFLVYRPRHALDAEVALRLGAARLALGTTYRSRQYVTRSNTKWLGDFATFNFRVGHRLSVPGGRLAWGLKVLNLTDRAHQWTRGYPQPGRLWTVTTDLEL